MNYRIHLIVLEKKGGRTHKIDDIILTPKDAIEYIHAKYTGKNDVFTLAAEEFREIRRAANE